ncbi:hypothetical protein QBC47DRAFT_358299 [Echria macrotheca]|uniref:FAS1 domain-containing protein n=1 Tax=Echria macrotheca TaxID=438768 RepID=A0AAJ0BJT2_9PEZI|nr:hypothetical protein QBC47DRAFT_358299 [Echria macrotheca]
MHLFRLLPLGLAAYVTAQALTDVLTQNSNTLSTLTSLLQTVPDIVQTLSTAQNVTILAPSNDAFARLMARNPRSTELTRNPRLLAGVLQYHVLQGKIAANEITAVPKFPATLLMSPFANVTGGQRVEVALVNNTALVFSGYKQPAMVVTADVAFSGGVVHIISEVLTVPASPAQTAINTGLTSLAGALTMAGLADGINGLSDVTIFAPSNDAFKAIGSATGSLSTQALAGILAYHVLGNQVRFSTDLIAAGSPVSLATAQGTNLTLRRENGQLFVNSARVLIPDIPTTNGVVHVIDNVLNPANASAQPNPTASVQAPAFSGVTAVADAPFTSGIAPTATFVPASVPLNAGISNTAPRAGFLLVAVGMMVAML